ncbi:MAG: AAA family ATPase [Thermoplasmata archaeon]|nr:AAA family ATPase [Thermoplasmata archaeon]
MKPLLLVFAGLPGTGKSTLARAMAVQLGAVWLRVDTLEAAMLKAGLPQSFETGLAAYVAAQDTAIENLELGRGVVVDAVNGVAEAREMWHSAAGGERAGLQFVEVRCSDPAVHRGRVEGREAPTPPLAAPTWEEVCSRAYLAWDEPIFRVDTIEALDLCLAKIARHLAESGYLP